MPRPRATPDNLRSEEFWIVWCPTGPTPPRKTYELQSLAEAEAVKMAQRFPDSIFYVLRAESSAFKNRPILDRLSANSIPF